LARQDVAVKARPARIVDAGEIVRLAGIMFQSMGLDLDHDHWPAVAEQAVRDRLGIDMMAFVVDDPREPGRLVCSAAGTVHRRLPRPGIPDFIAGYVQWVATDETHRKRGLAQAVMICLLDWFRERTVTAVELHATPAAESLYLSMGFTDNGPRALRIRSLPEWRTSPTGS
jgi:GNAT superfamily N-acetyltransferase